MNASSVREAGEGALFSERLATFAEADRDRAALVHVDERGREAARLSYGALSEGARRAAHRLCERYPAGERVLLSIESPLECLTAFLACHYAALVPVPVLPPRRNKVHAATAGIAVDCRPACVVTLERHVAAFKAGMEGAGGPEVMAVEELVADAPEDLGHRRIGADDLALLQYTSGSTSAPKGVMVAHGNLRANLRQISEAMRTDCESRFVSWIPLFHDMGLILTALHALSVGGSCVFMTPAAFSQRPLTWLRMISAYEADVAGAPDFAYEHCVRAYDEAQARELDLSSWRVAFNAAEPVRAATIQRFAETYGPHGFDRRAFYPCYGLAECTVFASGDAPGQGVKTLALDREALSDNRVLPVCERDRAHVSVGCGRAVTGVSIRAVNPETHAALGEREIGEIWIQGPNVARGYWGKPGVSDGVFRARIAGEDGCEAFLRTGDQGFLDDGRVHITGRLKDVMIVRGRNIHPQDVERTVESSNPAFRPSCAAAFVVEQGEDPVLVVAAELERTWRNRADPADVLGSARAAVAAEFDLRLHELVLLRTGSIPKTTSGKIRRSETRARYLAGDLETADVRAPGPVVAGAIDE